MFSKMMKVFIGLFLSILLLLFLGNSVSAAQLWYVTQNPSANLYTYDPATGDTTNRGSLNINSWGDIAMTPSGDLYGISWAGVSGTTLYKLNPGDEITPAGFTAVSGTESPSLNALGWADNGFWSAERNGSHLYRWENVGGTLPWKLSDPINGSFNCAGDMELGPDASTLYATDFRGTAISAPEPSHLYTVDRTTGVPTEIGEITGIDYGIFGLASSDGTLYGFETKQNSNVSAIYTIDPTTLVATKVLDLGNEVWGATSVPVPIPGAVWLLGSGLIGLAGLRRKFTKV